MALSHHPGINSTLLLNIKRVTVQYWHTLEYVAKLTSFYWLAVRNANGTDIKRLHTFCGLNSTLLELGAIKSTTWQWCCDLNTHPQAPTHGTLISQEILQLFHNSQGSTGSVDKELPSVKAMRSEIARWGNVLFNLAVPCSTENEKPLVSRSKNKSYFMGTKTTACEMRKF